MFHPGQFARLIAAMLICSFLSSFSFAQSIDELERAAREAKERREKLQLELAPKPQPKAPPARIAEPTVTPHVEASDPPLFSGPSLGKEESMSHSNAAWTPAVGDVLRGSSYQAHDGGINPRLNNGIRFAIRLKITSVSTGGSSFSGVLTYTTYQKNGRTGYWGAEAQVQGQINGNRCTLLADRVLYVPPRTFLSLGTASGSIQDNQLSGTWRSSPGGFGHFRLSLPSSDAGGQPSTYTFRRFDYP